MIVLKLNRTICYLMTLLCWLGACSSPQTLPLHSLEVNLKHAGKNRSELEKVLAHFSNHPGDSLKYKSAVFLISNMENYYDFSGEWPTRIDALFYDRVSTLNNEGIQKLRDSLESQIGKPQVKNIEILPDLKHLSSSYLINNVEAAYTSWKEAPWSASVSFDAFCNYILPYKSSTEHTENWRMVLKEKYDHILLDPGIPKNMTDVCCTIIDDQRSWFHWTGRLGYFPGVLSINQILRAKKGSCNEMANLGAYSARALGIPVAIDYTPQYGNDNDAHRWNTLILSDSSSEHFEGGEARPGDMDLTGELEQKFAKVFRQYGDWVSSSFAARALESGINDIPEFLADPRIKDVTASYTNVSDVSLSIQGKQGTPVYLCVFKRRSWVAIAGGFINDGTALFPKMGKELVYLPMFYSQGRYRVAGPPLLLPVNGQMSRIQSGEGKLQTIRLQRKYPFKRRWKFNLANDMTGARFEGSQDSTFQNPVLIHKIEPFQLKYEPKMANDLEFKDRGSYDSCWTEVKINQPVGFQYMRIVFDNDKAFKIGEMEFYLPGNKSPLTGRSIGNVSEPLLAFDGFPGKSIKLKLDTSIAYWVGLDFGQKKEVERIRYIPATDRNAVQNGKTYELYYWKNKWISAGQQKGTGLPLEYGEVPSGSVYWLNCKNCETDEERIFTYEDDRQIWW